VHCGDLTLTAWIRSRGHLGDYERVAFPAKPLSARCAIGLLRRFSAKRSALIIGVFLELLFGGWTRGTSGLPPTTGCRSVADQRLLGPPPIPRMAESARSQNVRVSIAACVNRRRPFSADAKSAVAMDWSATVCVCFFLGSSRTPHGVLTSFRGRHAAPHDRLRQSDVDQYYERPRDAAVAITISRRLRPREDLFLPQQNRETPVWNRVRCDCLHSLR
jgi:hypothetical protein